MELKYQGLIEGDVVNETDYLLGSENPLEIPYNENKNNYLYNQGKKKRTRNACVLYANAASLGYTMDYEFSEKELLEIVDLAEKKYGWKEDGGMYISKGVDCVRTWWNTKYPDRKVKTFRMEIGDESFAQALKNNYRVVVGYRTCSAYYKDSQDDGIVEGEKFSNFHGGHCVTSIFKNGGIFIEDNYKGTKKYNEYLNNNINKLKNSGAFFPSAFIYLKEETMVDKIKDNIDIEKAKTAMDNGFWNGLNPRQPASRQEVATMIESMYELVPKKN